jgi:hypothetical protein
LESPLISRGTRSATSKCIP